MSKRESDVVDGNLLTRRLIPDSTRDKSKSNPYRDLNDSDMQDEATRQYWSAETRIPWRAITLAAFLSIGGTALLLTAVLVWSGLLVSHDEHEYDVLILMCLGLLMFIPGFYHIRIAYHAYHQCEGFSFNDIPDFE